jgi:hypothetical protein
MSKSDLDRIPVPVSWHTTQQQGLTPLSFPAHLDVESLPPAHGTEDGVHPVSAAALGQPFYTAAPVLG